MDLVIKSISSTISLHSSARVITNSSCFFPIFLAIHFFIDFHSFCCSSHRFKTLSSRVAYIRSPFNNCCNFLLSFVFQFFDLFKSFIFDSRRLFFDIGPHVLCVDTGRSSETAKAHRG
eukprot:TRINITY_DN1380_c0_g1_i3.p2 TRINITY_DN1380_c0_g1~~TRINITY_DN1380_c0_g1_i3.p2  ORF type:complete len:118 (+),score=18.66 TRINITY_DN1380_c0_g1_i3:269-622(+)